MALEDGIGEFAVVLVAIVEREGGERLGVLAAGEAGCDLIERDDVKACRPNLDDHAFEEGGRHFQDAIGFERTRRIGPHVVQHEDHAKAAREWREETVHTGKMRRGQGCLHKICAIAMHETRNGPDLGGYTNPHPSKFRAARLSPGGPRRAKVLPAQAGWGERLDAP